MNRIKELRTSRKLSLRDLGEQLNIDHANLSKMERSVIGITSENAVLLAKFFGVSVDFLLGVDLTPPKAIPFINDEFKPIRIIGSIRAGEPNEVFQNTVGYLMAKVNDPDNYFYLQVVGDSMSPTLLDGDYVLVRFQNTASNNQIVVAGLNGTEATVKRFKMIGSDMFLFPDNENYDPIKLSPELHPYIVGVVIGLYRPHLK